MVSIYIILFSIILIEDGVLCKENSSMALYKKISSSSSENSVKPDDKNVKFIEADHAVAKKDSSKRGVKKKVENLMRTLNGRSSNLIEGRFLNLFQLVTFNNAECISGTGVRGVCVHSFECTSVSGARAVDSCAEGYGVCCVFQHTCGEQASTKCATFTNPEFPEKSEDILSCTLTIQKTSPSINQLRIDFAQMELLPPRNGTCVDDQFVIIGQNINNVIPIICGINNGQHIYVEVGESPGPFYISVLSASKTDRIFQIEICQLEPEDREAAPSGCLQYYTESNGVLESFNYQFQSSLQIYKSPGYYNNLNYAICIKRATETCSITYSTSDENQEYEFQILNYDSDGVPLIPPKQAGAEIFNCPDDFIVLNGIRLCGERLNDATVTEDFTINAPVTELGTGPITFVFRTNGNVTGRGFHLLYKQNGCITSKNN